MRTWRLFGAMLVISVLWLARTPWAQAVPMLGQDHETSANAVLRSGLGDGSLLGSSGLLVDDPADALARVEGVGDPIGAQKPEPISQDDAGSYDLADSNLFASVEGGIFRFAFPLAAVADSGGGAFAIDRYETQHFDDILPGATDDPRDEFETDFFIPHW